MEDVEPKSKEKRKVGGLPAESAVAGAVENLFSGMVVNAWTSFPVRNGVISESSSD
ncbi:hypothetical protein RND71_026677 [Anisodus tanguticus]|uniref:Uncharacterized protein n=1 Tax=Anisodus tanguticus TaxID=243964 RepID=A0AAE1RPC5_9SOLA|nr:hypothetical protein RND71_026677 [Anisodus tanguticus]